MPINRMKKWPFVSLIATTYNGFDLTDEFIRSALKTTYPHLEIIIVDNVSTDNSLDKLRRKYGQIKNLRFVKNRVNGFVAGGYNFGAKFAKGEYIVCSNNDVAFDRNWLKPLVTCALKHPTAIIQPKTLNYYNPKIIDSAGGIYNFWGLGRAIGGEDVGQCEKDLQVDFAHATIFIANKKFLNKIGGLDDWYKTHYEDVDLCLRARKYGGSAWYCHKSIVYHKVSGTYKHKTPSTVVMYHVRKNRLRTVLKNFSGVEKYMRVTILLVIDLLLILKDLLSLKIESGLLTLKSVKAAFSPQH